MLSFNSLHYLKIIVDGKVQDHMWKMVFGSDFGLTGIQSYQYPNVGTKWQFYSSFIHLSLWKSLKL